MWPGFCRNCPPATGCRRSSSLTGRALPMSRREELVGEDRDEPALPVVVRPREAVDRDLVVAATHEQEKGIGGAIHRHAGPQLGVTNRELDEETLRLSSSVVVV